MVLRGALGLFVLAVLSKTVTATLPGGVAGDLLVAARAGCRGRRTCCRWCPFSCSGRRGHGHGLVGAARSIGAAGPEFDLTLVERCLIAGRAIWFYLGKLFWPTDLVFIYPRWQVSQAVWWQYLFPLAALLLLAVLWAIAAADAGAAGGAACSSAEHCSRCWASSMSTHSSIRSWPITSNTWRAWAMIALASAGAALLLERWGLWRRPGGYVLCLGLLAILAGLTFRQSRMYADIETLYRTTIAANPDCWMAHNNLGLLLAGSGQFDEAIVEYRKALEIKPDYAAAHNNLGNALCWPRTARRGHRRVPEGPGNQARLRRGPQQPWHCLVQPRTDRRGHRRVPEGPENQARLRGGPQQPWQRPVRPRTARRGHRRVPARPWKSSPTYAEAHNNLGNALLGSGRLDEAIAEYQKALEIEPDYAEAHNNLGNALVRRGRIDEAIAEYQKALKIKPDYAEAHYNLGNALIDRGRFDEAIAEYQKALEIRPDYAEAHNNLGSSLASSGRLDEAIAEYQQALEIKPGYQQARSSLAMALAQRAGVLKALAQQRESLRSRPNDLAL